MTWEELEAAVKDKTWLVHEGIGVPAFLVRATKVYKIGFDRYDFDVCVKGFTETNTGITRPECLRIATPNDMLKYGE